MTNEVNKVRSAQPMKARASRAPNTCKMGRGHGQQGQAKDGAGFTRCRRRARFAEDTRGRGRTLSAWDAAACRCGALRCGVLRGAGSDGPGSRRSTAIGQRAPEGWAWASHIRYQYSVAFGQPGLWNWDTADRRIPCNCKCRCRCGCRQTASRRPLSSHWQSRIRNPGRRRQCIEAAQCVLEEGVGIQGRERGVQRTQEQKVVRGAPRR